MFHKLMCYAKGFLDGDELCLESKRSAIIESVERDRLPPLIGLRIEISDCGRCESVWSFHRGNATETSTHITRQRSMEPCLNISQPYAEAVDLSLMIMSSGKG